MTTEERIENFCFLWLQQAQSSDNSLVPGNKKLMEYLKENYFTAPASTKYHGAYEGGLYDHSVAVFKRLRWLTENNNLKWQRPESPFIIGMFHDLCKCDQYIKVFDDDEYVCKDGMFIAKEKYHYEYNTNTLLKGHGTKSVMILSQFLTLTEEEVLCIRYHMGAYGNEDEQKSEWAGFDAAIKKTNGLCLWVHAADMLASKIDGV